MDHLFRELAPISQAAWAQIDGEAKERLTPHLAGRRVVDWRGPRGWEHSATNLGRVTTLSLSEPVSEGGVTARQRSVLPMVEFRVPFTLSRTELDNAERGADDLDLDPLDEAARRAAMIENRAVFHAWPDAGILGMAEASPHPPLPLGDDAEKYPHVVARAVDTLRTAGIGGPYGLVIGPAGYTHIVETTEHGGYLLIDHLKRVLGGGTIARAIGVDTAIVLSLRGGDFILEAGQDLAIGYSHHDADTVSLYLEESFTFRVAEPDAAIALT